MVERAPASLGKRLRGQHAHFGFLVEQSPHQCLQRDRRIGQFVAAHRARQRLDMIPLGMVQLGMQALAPLLALGKVLDQQAAGDTASRIVLAHPRAHQRRNLFGLVEIALRRLGQRFAVQRDDPLIALASRRQIEGDRQIPLPEQRRQRRFVRRLRQPIGIELHIAAQFAAAIVAHQQADDALLCLRLQRQLPGRILQRSTDQRGQRQRLREQPFDRRRIGVCGQDLIQHRAKPHDAPARMTLGDGEAERAVEIGGRWIGIGHAVFRHPDGRPGFPAARGGRGDAYLGRAPAAINRSARNTSAAPISAHGGGFPPGQKR